MNYRIVEAVTRHREHREGRQGGPDLTDAVHVADALSSTGQGTEICQPRHFVDLSDEYLERTGLLGEVRMFRSANFLH
jgi:hypothetical protein